ncbi:hypothetical protein [Bacillus sp. FJAT-27251]|uniref:hypothetical protein n=1 Tax=Bacillus sp. FJAT-27251 TaxID=1684142 RepID=UPI0006A76E0F|nr:hypothetical protein [Bacillus sp. FJAT-27251]
MAIKNTEQRQVRNFQVEQIIGGHPIHKRHEFSFHVDGCQFKGHFHKDEITWMHPHPKQIIGEEKEAEIKSEICELLGQHGVASWIEDIEMTQVFENTARERRQVTLTVRGHEFKGYVRETEIHWFHPHPQQKLKDKHVDAIEKEIHQKAASF